MVENETEMFSKMIEVRVFVIDCLKLLGIDYEIFPIENYL